MSGKQIADELVQAVGYQEQCGEGRVIREVLYALERAYGVEPVIEQMNHVAKYDENYRETLERRKKTHRNGRLG